MEELKVGQIIMQLRKNEIGVFDIPAEYKDSKRIIEFERESGLRLTGQRGFDVISNKFFVEENLYSNIREEKCEKCVVYKFEDFASYYDFLDGDIYNNACYAFCYQLDSISASYKVDLKKLMARKSFVENTIDDYFVELAQKEKDDYEKGSIIHKQCQQWIKRFNRCESYNELVKVKNNYMKSKLSSVVDVTFFFFQYIFADIRDKHRFSVIMEYMSSDEYPSYKIINALCSIYDPNDVMQSYNYSLGSKRMIYKYKKRLKDYIQHLQNEEIAFDTKAYFSPKNHYFYEETQGYNKDYPGYPLSTICRSFESFEEFINYRKGDLTNCDLSDAFEFNVDFSKYIVNETTKLPLHTNSGNEFSIKKFFSDNVFHVCLQWCDKSGNMIKEYRKEFKYFFDFLAFLKRDLSNADLLYCDGLINLREWDDIDLNGAKMKSDLCEKFGLSYVPYIIHPNSVEIFERTEKNEDETSLVLKNSRNLCEEMEETNLSKFDFRIDDTCQKVCYISDIHLMHKIQNERCRSKDDIRYLIGKIVDTITTDVGNLLLIDGDVASDFTIFQLFVKMLYQAIDKGTDVIFTLGNHELWSFPNLSLNQIVDKYRSLLEQYGMYLLHNDIFVKKDYNLNTNSNSETSVIKYGELCHMNDIQVLDCIRNARFVILGGLGFSGYNTEFNADKGIYRRTVDRTTEIKESRIFEDLYNHLYPFLVDKNTIILTHTPKKDWCEKEEPDENFVYVSGHTHRNIFYDDGIYRIYSDNQIGYNNNVFRVKTFLIDKDYDYFFDYSDGIFEITGKQYNDFYRGKNILMTFKREVNILYMLKKNGYYCFIHKSKKGDLTILNGGAMKKLESRDIRYYYDNMDMMISCMKKPLIKYTSFQKSISDAIKKIGGTGIIHGSIIDIDFCNHVYVNPIDLTVTAYWASDIIHKIVYPSIVDLLENNCPEIYEKYQLAFRESNNNPLVIGKQTKRKMTQQKYIDTDIYMVSRVIKKMQKIGQNILTIWNEEALRTKIQDKDIQ